MNPPNHALVPLRAVPTEIVAEWPAGTLLGHLAPADDGWLVAVPGGRRVDHVRRDGRVDVVAELPHPPAAIVAHKRGALVVTGPSGERGWHLVRLGSGPFCDLPDVLDARGAAWADDRLLIADSARGHVVAVDPDSGTSSPWLTHELLSRSKATSPQPGVNGLAVHGGWLYLTNTDRALLLRCPLDRADPAARLEVVAERLVADGLDVAPDGQIYLAAQAHDSVLRLDTYGYREDIAGRAQGLAGPTAVAVDPHDPTALYATTTGRLLRLTP